MRTLRHRPARGWVGQSDITCFGKDEERQRGPDRSDQTEMAHAPPGLKGDGGRLTRL